MVASVWPLRSYWIGISDLFCVREVQGALGPAAYCTWPGTTRPLTSGDVPRDRRVSLLSWLLGRQLTGPAWIDPSHDLAPTIVLLMTEEQEPISEAALEAVANLLAAAKHHGIGVTFEPDAVGWTVGYIQGMGGGNLASAYDLETAAKAAERPLDELAGQLSKARAAHQG